MDLGNCTSLMAATTAEISKTDKQMQTEDYTIQTVTSTLATGKKIKPMDTVNTNPPMELSTRVIGPKIRNTAMAKKAG